MLRLIKNMCRHTGMATVCLRIDRGAFQGNSPAPSGQRVPTLFCVAGHHGDFVYVTRNAKLQNRHALQRESGSAPGAATWYTMTTTTIIQKHSSMFPISQMVCSRSLRKHYATICTAICRACTSFQLSKQQLTPLFMSRSRPVFTSC